MVTLSGNELKRRLDPRPPPRPQEAFATTRKPGFPCQHFYQRGKKAGYRVCKLCGDELLEKRDDARARASLELLRRIETPKGVKGIPSDE